jgi:FAD/FMN-containing dehydrogenase
MWRVGLRPTEAITFLMEVIRTSPVETMWHAGLADGRIRVIDDKSWYARVERLQEQATALSGTLILEAGNSNKAHDLINKKPAAQIMAKIKQQLDPLGILNSRGFAPPCAPVADS